MTEEKRTADWETMRLIGEGASIKADQLRRFVLGTGVITAALIALGLAAYVAGTYHPK